jgi:predicted DNA-binding transcriptional regulator YafY
MPSVSDARVTLEVREMARVSSHRNALIVRLLAMVADLSRRDGCDLYDLAARHRVAVRTIRRDLDALAEAGVPLIDESDGRRKRWRIEGADSRARLAGLVDSNQVLAIQAALRGLSSASGTTQAVLSDLADRLTQSLGLADRQRLAAVADCFGGERGTIVATASDVLLPALTAVLDCRWCSVSYRRPDSREATYSVLPLKLFARDGAAYLLAQHRARGDMITLALHRLRRFVVSHERGEAPREFDARLVLDSQFGAHSGGAEVTYRLQFASTVAPFIRERRWHPDQKLRARADGSIVLTFRCRESYQVAAWVASWRSHVTVIEPQVLREELGALGRELATRYARSRR